MVAKRCFQRIGFIRVPQRRWSTVCIHIINVCWLQARIFQCAVNRQSRAINGRSGDVMGVWAHAKTHQLCINVRTARNGWIVRFQHHHTCTLTHHETIALFVPRTRGFLWLIVAGRQGFHCGKTTHAQGTNCTFSTTSNHDVGIAVSNHACSITNTMRTSGTGRYDAITWALVALHDGYMAGNQVNQWARDEKWIDFAYAASNHISASRFDWRQATYARANVHTNTRFVQAFNIV